MACVETFAVHELLLPIAQHHHRLGLSPYVSDPPGPPLVLATITKFLETETKAALGPSVTSLKSLSPVSNFCSLSPRLAAKLRASNCANVHLAAAVDEYAPPMFW